MKIYSPLQVIEPNHAEILTALKTFIEKQFMGFEADPFSSLTDERNNQFFLKGSSAILWVRVYFKPFSEQEAELLKTELQRLEQTLRQPIQPHIFSLADPAGESAPFDQGPAADYFCFHFIYSGAETAMVIEKSHFSKDEEDENKVPEPVSFKEILGAEGYRFSRQSQLSREELAELIDLSLELKHL